MKIIKVFFISITVLIVLLILAAIIFIKTFDVNRYRPLIISYASNALGRQVNFEKAKLSLSLAQGISLTVNNLAIAEDPAFGKGNFLTVKGISLGVDVPGYILKKEVGISGVLIDSPRLAIIRQKDGSINVQSLAQPAQIKGNASASAAIVLPALLISPSKITDASITFIDRSFDPALTFVIKEIGAIVKITPEQVLLNKFFGSIAGGSIQASGIIDDYLVKQDFSMSAEAQNLKIEELITQDKAPVKAEGLASGKINLKGAGFNPQAFTSNLSGEAELFLAKAKLKDINVLRTVLDKISIIPGLSQKIEAGLSERYKQKLTQKDTVLSDIKLPVSIENNRLVLKEMVLGADEFLFKGNGQAGFDGVFQLEGAFFIPQELSASMAAQVPQLEYLLNDDKQIYFPLKVSGQAGEMKFNVDAEYIARKLLVDQAKKQLFKVLDKVFGKEEPQQATGEDTTQKEQVAPPQEPNDKSATEEAISTILDKILKK